MQFDLIVKNMFKLDPTFSHNVALPKAKDHLKLVVPDIILEGDVDILDPVDVQEIPQLTHSFLL